MIPSPPYFRKGPRNYTGGPEFIGLAGLAQGNVPAIFDNTVSPMSRRTRLNDSIPNISGVAWQNKVCIYVQWPSIILPVIVVLACAVLLAITAFSNGTAHLWKSSSLAPLRMHVHESDELCYASDVKELEKAAKSTNVLLDSAKMRH